MNSKDRLKSWLDSLGKSDKLDSTIQTLEYMLARNSYNKAQEEALDISLDTLKLIKAAHEEKE